MVPECLCNWFVCNVQFFDNNVCQMKDEDSTSEIERERE